MVIFSIAHSLPTCVAPIILTCQGCNIHTMGFWQQNGGLFQWVGLSRWRWHNGHVFSIAYSSLIWITYSTVQAIANCQVLSSLASFWHDRELLLESRYVRTQMFYTDFFVSRIKGRYHVIGGLTVFVLDVWISLTSAEMLGYKFKCGGETSYRDGVFICHIRHIKSLQKYQVHAYECPCYLYVTLEVPNRGTLKDIHSPLFKRDFQLIQSKETIWCCVGGRDVGELGWTYMRGAASLQALPDTCWYWANPHCFHCLPSCKFLIPWATMPCQGLGKSIHNSPYLSKVCRYIICVICVKRVPIHPKLFFVIMNFPTPENVLQPWPRSLIKSKEI